ncbi:MAG: ABC transporter substrate-binding protein [Polyangiaceae bacterium]|nr:ABC transporter substrate-binding protein [Polyangiaceae bacterium]
MGKGLGVIFTCVALGLAVQGCQHAPDPDNRTGKVRIVFKHRPMVGNTSEFRERLASFTRAHPEVDLMTEVLPNAADLTHQYYFTALAAQSRDIDVFVADIIWIPEFARAGFLRDLSDAFPPADIERDFIEGSARAVIVGGRTFAVPWYVDVGLLYYRTDLVSRPPRTYDELESFANLAKHNDPSLFGYLWQARQYEGLICNGFESIWGHGGVTMQGDRVTLDTPQARAGLDFLRGLLDRGTSPKSVTSAMEEDSRRVFEQGRAVFMRNWPYAWTELQKEDSPVRGKIGVAPLPTTTGEPGFGALGGGQLVINAAAPQSHFAASIDLVRTMTSLDANIAFAVANGQPPPRKAAYTDERLKTQAPFIASLYPIVARSRPRPVTAYYNMISDIIESEFSAAVTGIRSTPVAFGRAQLTIDRIAQ